jgi:hypothetical protein
MKIKLFIASLLCYSGCFGQGKFFGGNGDGFAVASFTNVVLPLHLSDFSGRTNGNDNILFWSTLSESNSRDFEIERSTDGVQFGKIGEVPAAGNSSSIHSYTFTDYHPSADKYFYRLKQTDIDEKYTFSNTILLKRNGAGITVYPNPAIQTVSILFGYPVRNEVYLLVNSNGQTVQQLVFNGTTATINLAEKPAGLYYLINPSTGAAVVINKIGAH